MKFSLVLDLAADGIPVAVACRVPGFSKHAFYAWKAAPVTERDWSDVHLINAAVDVHRDDPAFGCRFIADELGDQGFSAGENRVARLQHPTDLVRVRQETRPDPQSRAAGAR